MTKRILLNYPAVLGMVVMLAGGLANQARAVDFNGPFPSWRNLKTYYGAAGDGVKDDTVALQHALNDLNVHQGFCVLYVPAGQYRLTSTVSTIRTNGADGNSIAIIGESPTNTFLRWDGPAGATVVQYDAWYSKISRLTIDGGGVAGVDLAYGPDFSTYNETSDLVLQGAAIGLLLGYPGSMGQAENEVLRCSFSGCSDSGIKTASFNALDIWVWYCTFDDCNYGVYNEAGAFQVWQNFFQNSTTADIGIQNHGVFSFVNNTSIGSRQFLKDLLQLGAEPTTISGNRILNSTGDFPLLLGDSGPYLVAENIFRLPNGSANQAVSMSGGAQTFVGNIYTSSNAVRQAGYFRSVDETVVSPQSVSTNYPVMPVTPQNNNRQIFEVAAGASAAAIQQVIKQAEQDGNYPIVHIPMGVYDITNTLIIPAGWNVQLVGDGAGAGGTSLNWTGPPGGLLLQLQGPSRATLQDLHLNCNLGQALRVQYADQAGGKIFADQLNVSGPLGSNSVPSEAVQVNGLAQTDVEFRCLQSVGNSGVGFSVVGPGYAATNQVSIFTGDGGASAGNYVVTNSGALVVRGLWHEGSGSNVPSMSINGAGTLSVDACSFTYPTSKNTPMASLTNFNGTFTLATSGFNPIGASNACEVKISGAAETNSQAMVLDSAYNENQLGVTSGELLVNGTTPASAAGIIGCGVDIPGASPIGGFFFLADVWANIQAGAAAVPTEGTLPNTAFEQQLDPLLSASVWLPSPPTGTSTHIQIYRVIAEGGPGAVVEITAGK